MTRHAATHARWIGLVGCGFAVACSSPAPPYADLSLRDALGADPDVLAALSAPDLTTLADRLEAERLDEHDDAGGAPGPASSAPGDVREGVARESRALDAVRALDDARRTAGDDALIVATAVPRGDGVVIAAGAPEGAAAGALPPLPALEGPPAAASADAEALALQGHAGQIVAGLLRSTGSRRLARVTRWPVGAVAAGGVVYVNASWLVAMSALEPRDGGKPRPVLLGGALLPPPTSASQGLPGSPFGTYATLAACVADQTSRCETCLSGGACDSLATLTDFASPQAECAFLVADGGSQQSPDELCVLALTSIGTVAQCVEDDGCAPPPSNNASVAALPGADAFLASDTCVRSLDLCLSGQNVPLDGGTAGSDAVEVQGCLGPVQACSSAFDALGDACRKDRCSGQAGPSCSSCSGCATCSSCSQGTRTGSGTGYGSAGTGQNPRQAGSGSGSSGSGGSSGSSGGAGDGGSDGGGSGSGSSSGAGSSSGSGRGSSTGSSSGGSGSGSGGTGTSSGTATSSSSGCGGCTGGGSGGGSSCTGGGCGSSCSSTFGSSSSSSSSGGSGCQGCGGSGSSSGSSGGGSCNQCTVTPDSPAPSEPPVSLLWMALPVVYLQRRVQLLGRRS